MTPEREQQVADDARGIGAAILERFEDLDGTQEHQLAIATAAIAFALGTIAQQANDPMLVHSTARLAMAVAAGGDLVTIDSEGNA